VSVYTLNMPDGYELVKDRLAFTGEGWMTDHGVSAGWKQIVANMTQNMHWNYIKPIERKVKKAHYDTRAQRSDYAARLSALKETDYSWFAGWLCADGCIPKDASATIKFTICDKDPLEMFSNLFGNKVSPPLKPSGLGKQVRYFWGIRGFKAAMILEKCMPWLSARYKAKAVAAIAASGKDRKPKKLTRQDVEYIKTQLATGKHGIGKALALKYGVTSGMISSVKYQRTWGDVGSNCAKKWSDK